MADLFIIKRPAKDGKKRRQNSGNSGSAQQMVNQDEDTKQRIMEEARSLFFRFGFSKVTMDEAAEGLGMSKKTLYKYFPSKEDLLQEVTRCHIEGCDAELKSICTDSAVDPLERLKRLMNYVAGIYNQMSEALVHDLRRHAPEIW